MYKDADIREPLFMFLEERYGKNRILEEKNTGKSRADVVMVLPDEIWGIEIKSDADTYARLSRQVKDYDVYFDRNCVVVGSTHAAHVSEHVPEYWGIISVEETEEGADFYVIREPEVNPYRNMVMKLSFLWRPEIAHIQEMNGLFKYAGKNKLYVIEYLIDAVPADALNRQVSDELFERDYTVIFDKINEYRAAHGKHRRKRSRKKRKRKNASI